MDEEFSKGLNKAKDQNNARLIGGEEQYTQNNLTEQIKNFTKIIERQSIGSYIADNSFLLFSICGKKIFEKLRAIYERFSKNDRFLMMLELIRIELGEEQLTKIKGQFLRVARQRVETYQKQIQTNERISKIDVYFNPGNHNRENAIKAIQRYCMAFETFMTDGKEKALHHLKKRKYHTKNRLKIANQLQMKDEIKQDLQKKKKIKAMKYILNTQKKKQIWKFGCIQLKKGSSPFQFQINISSVNCQQEQIQQIRSQDQSKIFLKKKLKYKIQKNIQIKKSKILQKELFRRQEKYKPKGQKYLIENNNKKRQYILQKQQSSPSKMNVHNKGSNQQEISFGEQNKQIQQEESLSEVSVSFDQQHSQHQQHLLAKNTKQFQKIKFKIKNIVQEQKNQFHQFESFRQKLKQNIKIIMGKFFINKNIQEFDGQKNNQNLLVLFQESQIQFHKKQSQLQYVERSIEENLKEPQNQLKLSEQFISQIQKQLQKQRIQRIKEQFLLKVKQRILNRNSEQQNNKYKQRQFLSKVKQTIKEILQEQLNREQTVIKPNMQREINLENQPQIELENSFKRLYLNKQSSKKQNKISTIKKRIEWVENHFNEQSTIDQAETNKMIDQNQDINIQSINDLIDNPSQKIRKFGEDFEDYLTHLQSPEIQSELKYVSQFIDLDTSQEKISSSSLRICVTFASWIVIWAQQQESFVSPFYLSKSDERCGIIAMFIELEMAMGKNWLMKKESSFREFVQSKKKAIQIMIEAKSTSDPSFNSHKFFNKKYLLKKVPSLIEAKSTSDPSFDSHKIFNKKYLFTKVPSLIEAYSNFIRQKSNCLMALKCLCWSQLSFRYSFQNLKIVIPEVRIRNFIKELDNKLSEGQIANEIRLKITYEQELNCFGMVINEDFKPNETISKKIEEIFIFI